jgi:hypothetical protein
MTSEIILVGYCCPICWRRVVVFCSLTQELPRDEFHSKCECGYKKVIPLAEVQELDVWREITPVDGFPVSRELGLLSKYVI